MIIDIIMKWWRMIVYIVLFAIIAGIFIVNWFKIIKIKKDSKDAEGKISNIIALMSFFLTVIVFGGNLYFDINNIHSSKKAQDAADKANELTEKANEHAKAASELTSFYITASEKNCDSFENKKEFDEWYKNNDKYETIEINTNEDIEHKYSNIAWICNPRDKCNFPNDKSKFFTFFICNIEKRDVKELELILEMENEESDVVFHQLIDTAGKMRLKGKDDDYRRFTRTIKNVNGSDRPVEIRLWLALTLEKNVKEFESIDEKIKVEVAKKNGVEDHYGGNFILRSKK